MKTSLAANPSPPPLPPPPIASLASDYVEQDFFSSPSLAHFYPQQHQRKPSFLLGEYEAHSHDDYESFHSCQTSDTGAKRANRSSGLDFSGFSSHTEWASLSYGPYNSSSWTLHGTPWASRGPWQAQQGAFSDSTARWSCPSLYHEPLPMYFRADDYSPYLHSSTTAWQLHRTSAVTSHALPYAPALTCTLAEPSEKQTIVNLAEHGQLQVQEDTLTQKPCILSPEEGCQGGGITLLNMCSLGMSASAYNVSHEAKPVSSDFDEGTVDTSAMKTSNVPCINDGVAASHNGMTSCERKSQHLGAQTADSSLPRDEPKIHCKPPVNKGPDAENAESSQERTTCTASDFNSGDVHSSRGCKSLISSIHYLSTVLTYSLCTENAKDCIDANTLETSIRLLSYCLLKRSSKSLTKTSYEPLMKSQQSIQEQLSKPKVPADVMTSVRASDKEIMSLAEAVPVALSHGKYAQDEVVQNYIEEAVHVFVKKQLEKPVKEALNLQGHLSKLQEDISHELSESNAAVCQYKCVLREARKALDCSTSELRKTETELESLKLSLSRLKNAGAFCDSLEHGSLHDDFGLDLSSLPLSSHATEEQQQIENTQSESQDSCVSISGVACSSDSDTNLASRVSVILARAVPDLDLSVTANSRNAEGLMAADVTSHIAQSLESGRSVESQEQVRGFALCH